MSFSCTTWKISAVFLIVLCNLSARTMMLGGKNIWFSAEEYLVQTKDMPPPPPSNLRDSPFISMYICARVYHPQLKYKHVNIYPLPVPVISMLLDSYSQQGVNWLTTFTPANVSVTGALIVLITGLKEKPSCICGILELIHP